MIGMLLSLKDTSLYALFAIFKHFLLLNKHWTQCYIQFQFHSVCNSGHKVIRMLVCICILFYVYM